MICIASILSPYGGGDWSRRAAAVLFLVSLFLIYAGLVHSFRLGRVVCHALRLQTHVGSNQPAGAPHFATSKLAQDIESLRGQLTQLEQKMSFDETGKFEPLNEEFANEEFAKFAAPVECLAQKVQSLRD